MTRAILLGKKTVTRRIVKFPLRGLITTDPSALGSSMPDGTQAETSDSQPVTLGLGEMMPDGVENLCPYGPVGSRLWIKEAYYAFGQWQLRINDDTGHREWHFLDLTTQSGQQYQFRAPSGYVKTARTDPSPGWWLRPSLFMPRRASRIALEITDVRIERLRDITEDQALAEGFSAMHDGVHVYFDNHLPHPNPGLSVTAVIAFVVYWQSINGRDSWSDNPWVWVVGFRRCEDAFEHPAPGSN
jgi:hypothetical protein